jgi:hypothetical protein
VNDFTEFLGKAKKHMNRLGWALLCGTTIGGERIEEGTYYDIITRVDLNAGN